MSGMRCRDAATFPTLEKLPDEIWTKIAAELSFSDRASLAATARKFRHAMDYGDLSFTQHAGFFGEDAEETITRAQSLARSYTSRSVLRQMLLLLALAFSAPRL